MHEAAHGIVCLIFKIIPCGLELSIFGIALKIPYIACSRRKILISAAGPFFSLCLFVILSFLGYIFAIKSYAYSFFAFINFYIGIINLLPLSPLDGGTILKSLFSKYLGIINGGRVYRIFTLFFYTVISVLVTFESIYGIFNPWIFLLLFFTANGIYREKISLIKNKKSVLLGEIMSKRRIKYIACDCESELLCLASRIGEDYTLLVAGFRGERFFGEINQAEIIDGIKKYGALCTVKEYIEKR